MSLLSLAILFGVGFSTWLLALVRTFALLKRQKFSVSSLVFVEETAMLWATSWVAQRYQLDGLNNALPIFVACGLGGAAASYIVMVVEDRRSQGPAHFRKSKGR